ncbi:MULTISPECIES: purine-nucleoside phosphorylase [Rheinheimera]|jgi:purine-nucleoside phosphorylase|uniref:Purine nucleoside phosphorylase DeoD-type n=2 Tax=Rheinheimera TaxID=67575 RepID=A0ABN1E243_9GAMM|nr:purine-nucleoside phosphorylase [Rheinheimera aquimaris]MCB5214721.1 purine-nucleoside phosphorylase [Rheinheimera aquimaris]MCD1598713.1 purine-nucleoside phosphorylase [Rheinheimera aquimaris]HBN89162.1 purine-nucleoside phosphorylase [Rheinheimera sp.]|tara:strand:- start:2375 stop:3076 length:702 start_codon:yes stop_codon:yes gene_type:complete
MATPHINAPAGAFAETVLMPGDPLRAKHIAETFLTDAVCVNTVRNMFGYTGTYNGKPVSVLGSGMGVPSMSIYATELVKFYGVKNIIRIGSCGGLPLSVKVRDVVIGMGASTDSGVNRNRLAGMDFAAIASFNLLEKAVAAARAKDIDVKVGNVFTSDLFYNPSETLFDTLEKYGVLAVEMEAAGLYGVAAEYGINALAIFTVSDHIRTGEALSAELRQTSFNEMVEVALGCL